MQIKIYQVNAFTDQHFGGNPAVICPLSRWLDDASMLALAQENNVSATAFFIPNKQEYDIRWFTECGEVNLCGYATLAAAFVIFNYLRPQSNQITFNSLSGPLKVTRHDNSITLDLPVVKYTFVDEQLLMAQILGLVPREIYKGEDYMVVLHREEQVRDFQPNFELIAKLEARGLIITARSKRIDYVARWFGPRVGINEDPASGLTHCVLAPYWSGQLGKMKLNAEQLSSRLGKIQCEVKGDRVLITGQAVLFLEGNIFLARAPLALL